jgi:two-component system, OmpR family, phosphate regulon sensor histidine kinase PhoR
MLQKYKFNIVIFFGFLSIIGVIVLQLLTLQKAYKYERNEINNKIDLVLTDVVKSIYKDNKSRLDVINQINKVTEDYYIVNVNDAFDHTILQYYLKNEFEKVKLDLDYEYAIYDCGTDNMIYGNYVSKNKEENTEKCVDCFVKRKGYTYYFAIRFPTIKNLYFNTLQNFWIYLVVLIVVLFIYMYSVILMLKQKKYTNLQNDFINNMTHEFKTPLSSILLASGYAQTQEEIMNNPKLKKYLQIIIEQSKKLNQHIERILMVAKTDANWIELQKTEVNLKEIIDNVIETTALKYQKNQLIENNISEKIFIKADGFHLYNVFYNLIENALKYAGEEPKILIEQEINKSLNISIKDNGEGINEHHINFVFDKFYRIPKPNSKEIEGFGIGLHYVKKIVTLHQWNINLKRNKPNGLIVTLEIPKKDIL